MKMQDESYVENRCSVCNEIVHNLDHKSSVNHRFHFVKWAYNNYRKALQNDRHGIKLDAEVEPKNSFNFDFERRKGKYITKVSQDQLQLHDSTLTFNCKITNNRKDSIYITSTNLVHPSKNFHLIHSSDFEVDKITTLKLLPGAKYVFKIIFTTNVLTCASYKIPLSCDFQTVDNKTSFTIVRTFLTKVDDPSEKKEKQGKSPFTKKSWSDVKTTYPCAKELRSSEDEYRIPPDYIKLLTWGLQRFSNINYKEDTLLTELMRELEQLTKDNYSRYWHIALWLEERAQALMLMKYNMEKVTVEIKGNILILEVPGLAEKRPSVLVGDFIRLRLSGEETAYKGFINKINEKTVEISNFHESLLQHLQEDPNSLLDVSFMLGRLTYIRKHRAVDDIVQTGLVSRLFPTLQTHRTNNTNLQIRGLFNQSIDQNEEQKQVVHNIVTNVQDIPYIVFGPPGTGKTITIIEAILQIKKTTKKTILVCAPSNDACDMLAMKLMEIGKCTSEELIRIYSKTREIKAIPEDLKHHSNLDCDEINRIFPEKLKTFRIVVATLVLVGQYRHSVYSPDCVFIDEAAQASEPEADIAISFVKPGKQVVLAGDPKQLGPLTTKSGEKLGLGISLMERLMQCNAYKPDSRTLTYNSHFITMLKSNFRSHPDILQIPNGLFYNRLLESKSGAAQRDPIVKYAIYPIIVKKPVLPGTAIEYYAVSSKEQKEGSSPSFFNLYELRIVLQYVRALLGLQLPDVYRVREDQIGIVTPYIRQVYKIKDALKRGGFPGIDVGTTEAFQGREKRIIIISTVRAQHSLLKHDKKYNLGFVANDQRFNVAVTRAISKLIVIGSPLVLRTDKKWKEFLDLCEEKGTYFGNYFPLDNKEFKEDVLARMKHFKQEDDQYNKKYK